MNELFAKQKNKTNSVCVSFVTLLYLSASLLRVQLYFHREMSDLDIWVVARSQWCLFNAYFYLHFSFYYIHLSFFSLNLTLNCWCSASFVSHYICHRIVQPAPNKALACFHLPMPSSTPRERHLGTVIKKTVKKGAVHQDKATYRPTLLVSLSLSKAIVCCLWCKPLRTCFIQERVLVVLIFYKEKLFKLYSWPVMGQWGWTNLM